jgi:hypothetical protein
MMIEWVKVVECPESKELVGIYDCLGCDYYEGEEDYKQCIKCTYKERKEKK